MPTIPAREDEEERRKLEKRRRELIDEVDTMRVRREEQAAREIRSVQGPKFYDEFNKRMDARGPTLPPTRYREGFEPETGGPMPGGVFERRVVPELDNPVRDEEGFGGADTWTADLAKPAAPEGRGDSYGMGSGGPENPVSGLSAEDIVSLKEYRTQRDSERSDLKMRQTLGLADRSPDDVARALDLSERTGANRLEVQENLKTFEQTDTMSRIDALRQSAPKVRSWLDDPVNLEVAHDDVENLGWWEQTQKFFSTGKLTPEKVGKSLEVGFGAQLQEALWGLDRMLGESNAAIYKALPDWVPGKFDLANEQVQRSLTADMNATAWGRLKAAEMPQGETWLERGIYGAASSAPATVIAAIATVATRNPSIGAGLMGGTTAGTAFQDARESGKSFADSLRYGLTQGGIETGTEFIPLKFLVGDLAADTPFAKTFFRQAAAEGITEQAATFLQDASTYIELNPDKTLAEFFAERPNAALETLVASTIMSGVQTTVAQGMQAAGDQIDKNAKQKRAEEYGRFIEAMGDNAANSKLLKRLPDKYREAVAAATKDGPRETVYIHPDAMQSLAQTTGKSMEELAQAFRIDPNEIVTATDTGEFIPVPIGNYAAVVQTAKKDIGVSGETIYSALQNDIKFGKGDTDFTLNEIKEDQALRVAEREAAAKMAETDVAFADSMDRFRASILEEVKATGLYTEQHAAVEADMIASIFASIPQNTGEDIETFWKANGARIVGALTGQQEQVDEGSLSQSVPRTPQPASDFELKWAAEDLEAKQFEAWKGAREGLSNEAIADRMNEVEPDAVATAKDVSKWLQLARRQGYDAEKAAKHIKAPETERIIELRARGLKNPEIAARVYPEVDTPSALNRVKALASKNKAKIEERKAALAGKELAQEQTLGGTFTPPRNGSSSVIALFGSRSFSTLSHEGAHWYLDTIYRLAKTENAHPFILKQWASILEWAGKSPSWDAMFQADGMTFTPEAQKMQELFAESFEVYVMTAKAPSTAMRSVFATMKQWFLQAYKALRNGLGGAIRSVGVYTPERIMARERELGRRMTDNELVEFVVPDEIRQVFDRMIAAEDAIAGAQAVLVRDSEALAKAMLERSDPEKKWTDKRREKYLDKLRERYAQARERAEADLTARLIDEHMRTKTVAWNEEKRDVRREVQSEIDERPEQRAYQALTGIWRDTRETAAEEAAAQAEAMLALAQADGYLGSDIGEAFGWVQASRRGLPMDKASRLARAKAQGFDTTTPLYHGSNSSFSAFRASVTGAYGPGVYLGDPDVAGTFAGYNPWDEVDEADIENGNIIPVFIRGKLRELSPQEADQLSELLAGNPEAGRKMVQNLTAQGYAGVINRENSFVNVFDPANVRSVNAAFDPDMTGSADLLAQGGDGDWMGAFLDSYVENPSQRSIERMTRKLFAQGIPPAIRLLRYNDKIIAFDGFTYTHDDAIQILGAPENAERALIESGDTLETVRWYDAGGSTLAQTVGEPRQLDELGFYSAAQEAAQRVPDGIWQMGWQAARNSLAKGRDGVVPKKTEIEWLGLDAMFSDTKLKGAALKAAVLEHIDARRLELVQNFARFDPNVKAPTKAAMLDELYENDEGTLADLLGLGTRREGNYTVVDSYEEITGALDFTLRPSGKTDYGTTMWELVRPLDGGEVEVLGTGVWGVLKGIAARAIVDAKKARVLRSINKDDLDVAWREWRASDNSIERTLVRGPGDIRLPGEDVPLFEMVIALPPGVPGSDYRAPSSHVGGKMQGTLVTAHGEERIDDKGQRTVFVGQVQSDMAQRAREIKEAQRINKAVIERANINSREAAMEHLLTWHAMSRTREEFIAEWAPYPDSKMIDAARSDWAGRNGVEYIYNAGDTPDAPLLSTSEWTNVAVRAMLYKAAREGFQSISFPTAETSEIIQGNDSAAMHYETNVKGALEKIAKQLGGEVRRGGVEYTDYGRLKYLVLAPDGSIYDAFDTREAAQQAALDTGKGYTVQNEDGKAPAYILDITPAMRAKIVTEGFPLFHTRPGVATTTPPASIPPMRLNLQAVLDQYGEKALSELPPEVAAYARQASDVEAYVELARTIRSTLAKKRPKSLWKFLSTARKIGSGNDTISYRGIRDTDGELLKIIGERKEAAGLIAKKEGDGKRSRSYDIEQAATAAWEEGYFSGESPPGPSEFIDAIRADLDGTAPLYTRDEVGDVQAIKNAEQWEAWFDQNDLDIRGPVADLRAKLAIVATAQGSNAITPDEAAPFFKFRDGAELLQAIKQGPLRDKLIREETERRMIERNGDVFRDGTIMAEAQAYARNEIQHRQFEIELDALAQAAGKGASANLAKQQAIENLRSKQVREVLNYNQWLTLERRWGEKAASAAAKGDMAKAAEFARYRLINSHMYTEGKKLAEQIEKTRKHLLKYEGKTQMARLFAAGKDYADQMRGLLSDYMLRNESKKAENKRAARAVWLKTQMAGIDPFAAYADPTKSPEEQRVAAAEAIERSTLLARLEEGVEAQNYKSITVDELLAVRDEADLIYRLATVKDRLIKEGDRRKLSLAAGDIAASVVANQPKERLPEPLESNLPGERRKRGLSGFMVSHRTFQALARQFDGGEDGGVFWRYIVRPLNDAFARKNTLMKQVGKDMENLFSTFTPAELGRFMRDRQTIDLGAGQKVTLTTQGRLAVALNAGNEKNLARLMDSNGWDRRQVQTIIDTLSKKEMDWVQATWDYLDTWFPEANRVHEAVHGLPMDKQPPLQLATRYGVYAGGYFPIAFDANRSSKAGQRKLEADAQAVGAGRVGARQEPGFAKKRVSGKVTLPLNLDPFSVILRHLDQVTTSIATEEALFDVGRLIKHPDVANAVVEQHGRVKYDEIIEAIKAAKFGLPVAQGSVEKILNHVRNGSTVAKLAWSVSTAMLQPSGISNSIVRIGFPWMMRGYGRMLGGAAQMEGWAKWAMERSEFMRNRRESQSPEQVNLLATLKGNKPLVMIQRSSFQLMAQVQFFSVDLATWYGAFDKATAGGADEALAVSMADQAVLDAQGGGEAFQTAGIQRGSVGVRLLTNLMSYMLTTYQLSVQSVAKSDPNLLTKIARISADMVLLWSVPVAATMAIRYAIAAAVGGDEDDEEYWSLENISREQVSFLMSPFFGLSQIAGAVKTDPYSYRGPAGLDMLVQTYKAVDAASHGDVEQLLRPVNQMVGMVFHLPANQIDKTVRGSLALWNGETESPLAIFFGPPKE